MQLCGSRKQRSTLLEGKQNYLLFPLDASPAAWGAESGINKTKKQNSLGVGCLWDLAISGFFVFKLGFPEGGGVD